MKVVVIIFLMSNLFAFGQDSSEPIGEFNSDKRIVTDSTIYTRDFKFKDGAYRTYEEFKFNSPSLLYQNKEEREKVWGYCQDGNVFISTYDELDGRAFLKIDIIGGMMLASNDLEQLRGGGQTMVSFDAKGELNESYIYTPSGTTSRKVRLQIMDCESGIMKEYNLVNFMEILKKDEYLYNEFSKLKRVQKKNMMFNYLKKYNINHPFYIMLTTFE